MDTLQILYLICVIAIIILFSCLAIIKRSTPNKTPYNEWITELIKLAPSFGLNIKDTKNDSISDYYFEGLSADEALTKYVLKRNMNKDI